MTEMISQEQDQNKVKELNDLLEKHRNNVFKVREVMPCPALTSLPKQDQFIKGVAHIRGQTISVIDLSKATGGPEIQPDENAFVIIAEYNRSVQGFLVAGVERIINIRWQDIMPPPEGAGKSSYLTAVTEIDQEMVSILDVEKIILTLE